MNSEVKDFIIDYLQREYTIETDDILSLNFVETGYVDSIGMLSFMLSIEDEFGVRFSDEEMGDSNMKVTGKLIELVSQKVEKK